MGLGGDAHKFVKLFSLCRNDISCYGHDKNVNSLLDEISFPREQYGHIRIDTFSRLNNFLHSAKDDQFNTIEELLKIAKTVIDETTNNSLQPKLLEYYENCWKIIEEKIQTNSEQKFLMQKFDPISFENLPIEGAVIEALQQRYKEMLICIEHGTPLAAVILCGGILETVLLGVAMQNRDYFEKKGNAPKDKKGEVRPVEDWKLANLIDVAYDLKILGEDVKQFSHSLRNFRNYIHPYKQIQSRFAPDIDTAKVCQQVLNAAINDLKAYLKKDRDKPF